jgi:hypothetical protein
MTSSHSDSTQAHYQRLAARYDEVRLHPRHQRLDKGSAPGQ